MKKAKLKEKLEWYKSCMKVSDCFITNCEKEIEDLKKTNRISKVESC